jgi:hypothetical protein
MTKGTQDDATDNALNVATDKTCSRDTDIKVKGAGDKWDDDAVNMKSVSVN